MLEIGENLSIMKVENLKYPDLTTRGVQIIFLFFIFELPTT